MAYRMEFLLEFVGSAIVPMAIQLVLWSAVFREGAETFGGATRPELVAYTLTSVLFSQVRGGDHDFEIAELVRNGSLSNYLLRPVGVIPFIYMRGVAPRLMFSGLCLVVGLASAPWSGINPLNLLGAMSLAFMGNIIHYIFGTALATVAFYWEEAYSMLMVKNLCVAILSGELIPLYLFPDQWSWVWKALPFHLYVFAPTQFALGKMSWGELQMALLQSVGWIAILSGVTALLWRIGIKRYASIGG